MGLGKLQSTTNYEDLRNARILENQNRLRTLGLQKTISELRSLVSQSPPKSPKTPQTRQAKKVVQISSLRRSDRLKQIPAPRGAETSPPRRSHRLRGRLFEPISGEVDEAEEGSPRAARSVDSKSFRPANMPWVEVRGAKACLSEEASEARCSSRGRGGVYDSLFGICCHFCRQKKLCGEEDCKRCGDLDVNEPCIGKTDCSVCHSTNGVLCRACLKVRYGEEMEDVIANKEWMCPHCIEDKGTIPYWMCNSSFCLKKRKIAPTGIAIYRAKELGYKSVAHLLMDELQGSIKKTK